VKGTLGALPGAEDVEVLPGPDVLTVTHDGHLDADAVRRAAARHNLTLVGEGDVLAAHDNIVVAYGKPGSFPTRPDASALKDLWRA
jgi:hypothetical protein